MAMARICVFVFVVVMILFQVRIICGWWPFSSVDKEKEAVQQKEHPAIETTVPAKFEIATADSKFLADAQQLLNMSPLDKCQTKVVSKLRSSCGEMSDEALGKLAVHLLNCQSQAESRTQYHCTNTMVCYLDTL